MFVGSFLLLPLIHEYVAVRGNVASFFPTIIDFVDSSMALEVPGGVTSLTDRVFRTVDSVATLSRKGRSVQANNEFKGSKEEQDLVLGAQRLIRIQLIILVASQFYKSTSNSDLRIEL